MPGVRLSRDERKVIGALWRHGRSMRCRRSARRSGGIGPRCWRKSGGITGIGMGRRTRRGPTGTPGSWRLYWWGYSAEWAQGGPEGGAAAAAGAVGGGRAAAAGGPGPAAAAVVAGADRGMVGAGVPRPAGDAGESRADLSGAVSESSGHLRTELTRQGALRSGRVRRRRQAAAAGGCGPDVPGRSGRHQPMAGRGRRSGRPRPLGGRSSDRLPRRSATVTLVERRRRDVLIGALPDGRVPGR
jgi:hypothetical protein